MYIYNIFPGGSAAARVTECIKKKSNGREKESRSKERVIWKNLRTLELAGSNTNRSTYRQTRHHYLLLDFMCAKDEVNEPKCICVREKVRLCVL